MTLLCAVHRALRRMSLHMADFVAEGPCDPVDGLELVFRKPTRIRFARLLREGAAASTHSY